jgi:phospholipid/cholesterol/gamma-HCH transport system substrate-binding protein
MRTSKRYEFETYLGWIMLFGIGFIISFATWLIAPSSKTYCIYFQLIDATGVKKGTAVKYRGTPVGEVVAVKDMVAKAKMYVKLPKSCFVEANQTGLLNETVIDISPLVISPQLLAPKLEDEQLEEDSILTAYKGVHYDDLVRATTRVAQRLDDPKLFEQASELMCSLTNLSDEMLALIRIWKHIFMNGKNHFN